MDLASNYEKEHAMSEQDSHGARQPTAAMVKASRERKFGVGVSFTDSTLARLDAEVALRGIGRSQVVEAALALYYATAVSA